MSSDPNEEMSPEVFAERFASIEAAVAEVVLGQGQATREVLCALLAGGHALLEGLPGVGKTLLCRVLARALGVGFRRLQFTPDLMPGDVTGGNVWDERQGDFAFRPGPLFTEVLLADEVNRAPARTQAALLEAMSDRQVSVDGQTRALPWPFFVVATQNPVESEGTYPLPEAQLDRFLLKIEMALPPPEAELALLRATVAGFDAAEIDAHPRPPVVDGPALRAMRAQVRRVGASDALLRYITELVAATRRDEALVWGASPRAAIAMLRCAQVVAASEGRLYVLPDDVRRIARPVLRHRLVLEPDALIDGLRPDEVLDRILAVCPVPEAPLA